MKDPCGHESPCWSYAAIEDELTKVQLIPAEVVLVVLAVALGVASMAVYFIPSLGSFYDFLRLQLAGSLLVMSVIVSVAFREGFLQRFKRSLQGRENRKP